ncbi:MAG: hypothetical protein JSV88_26470 [Candidatus Aminicenantes bacterium]|nr:MAG: hypothetical protein JSV88_26470 [Candidatus Aminicenantes bacterium]
MTQDPEIIALNDVYQALEGLNSAQIKRIINWVSSKFGVPGKEVGGTVTQTPTPTPVEAVQPAAEPVKKRRGRPPKIERSTAEYLKPEQAGIKGILKYETLEELYFSSHVSTISSKILLVAAYLQEKHNLKDFSSNDISSRLKKLGQRVPNISASINNLLAKKPPLLVQTGRLGDSRQSRRKYSVTEEGLRAASNFINK